jgi:hypothetical protein
MHPVQFCYHSLVQEFFQYLGKLLLNLDLGIFVANYPGVMELSIILLAILTQPIKFYSYFNIVFLGNIM